MKVAVYGQTYSDNAFDYVVELLDELNKSTAEIFFEEDFYTMLLKTGDMGAYPIFNMGKGLDNSFDMFISFGGDGTILRAITYVKNLNIPVVGVNTGRLGFLSTFKKEDVRKVVQEFVSGAYTIVERSLVEVSSSPQLPEFENLNPTAENIVVVIWNKLRNYISSDQELEITLYETARNFVTYKGE